MRLICLCLILDLDFPSTLSFVDLCGDSNMLKRQGQRGTVVSAWDS